MQHSEALYDMTGFHLSPFSFSLTGW